MVYAFAASLPESYSKPASGLDTNDDEGYVPSPALRASLTHLAGESLTERQIFETCWRLAGNAKRLTHNKPAPPWTYQSQVEWVPAQIISARRQLVFGDRGYQFTFQSLAGRCCPMKLHIAWKDDVCRRIAKLLIGFNFKRLADYSEKLPHHRYQHPTELVTMRLLLKVDPKLSGKAPTFEDCKVPPSLKAWNREQMDCRDRLDPEFFKCPMAYEPDLVPCYRCSVGLGRCRAATHPRDWETRPCPRCLNIEATFDMTVSAEVCLRCYNHEAGKRK